MSQNERGVECFPSIVLKFQERCAWVENLDCYGSCSDNLLGKVAVLFARVCSFVCLDMYVL